MIQAKMSAANVVLTEARTHAIEMHSGWIWSVVELFPEEAVYLRDWLSHYRTREESEQEAATFERHPAGAKETT